MSIEEIIKKLEEIIVMLDGLRSAYPETGKSGMADVLREAIALLRTHPDNQRGDPGNGEALVGERKQSDANETFGLPGGEGCGDSADDEPLTLEELRGMDGQPIYVVDRVYPPYSGWWIIGWTTGGCCVLAAAKMRGTQYIVQNYGIGWVAYRRPPKEA